MNWFELWRSLSNHDVIKIMRALREQAVLAGDILFDYKGKFVVIATQVLARGYSRDALF